MMFRRREKYLGTARGKRRYDLPLDQGAGAGFLVLLVALMTFLAMLALAASFALSAMTARWSVGLAHQVSVEISAVDDKGVARPRAEIEASAAKLAAMLRKHGGVGTVHALSTQEIFGLVKPWLGGSLSLANLPVPGLISVTLDGDADLKTLGRDVATVDPRAQVNSYGDWLGDILHFARALQFAAILLSLVVGGITAIAIAGAVQARLAVSRDHIEILHLMGAPGAYISRQFQRHSLRLALRGAAGGLFAGGAALTTIGWLAGQADVDLVPGFRLAAWQVAVLLLLPAVAGLIAIGATRLTVRRTLDALP